MNNTVQSLMKQLELATMRSTGAEMDLDVDAFPDSDPRFVLIVAAWRTRDWNSGVALFRIPCDADLTEAMRKLARGEYEGSDILSALGAWEIQPVQPAPAT